MSMATELIRARAAGRRAAQQDGARRSANPYPPRSTSARDRMLFIAWNAGYDTIRPMPVDYSSDAPA